MNIATRLPKESLRKRHTKQTEKNTMRVMCIKIMPYILKKQTLRVLAMLTFKRNNFISHPLYPKILNQNVP